MKKILNLSIALVLVSIFGVGCLKDKLVDEGLAGPKISESPNFIEIMGPVSGTTSYNTAYTISLNSSNNDTTFDVAYVRLASKDPAGEDIQVQLELVPSLLTAYNDSNGTHLVQPNPSTYSLANNMTVTIPRGQREGSLKMTTKPSVLTSGEFGLAFRVKSVSNAAYGISGNFKNAVATINVKNKYDGIYKYTATYKHPPDRDAAWTRTEFVYPYDTRLLTTGGNSVSFYNDAYAGTLVPLMTPGTSGFGATALDIVFDANDRVVSVNNPTPDSRNRQFTLNPTAGDSRYVAATKTLYLYISMGQNGFAAIPMEIKMEYIGPRP